jgi:hypothetical protein
MFALRWLKTVVVSDAEKAPGRCQVGSRETTGRGRVENLKMASEPGWVPEPGMSLAGAHVLARRCPA